MEDAQFKFACKLRVGWVQPFTQHIGACHCGQAMDAQALHTQKCTRAGLLQMRHNWIRDLFHEVFVAAKLQAQMEVTGFYLHQGDNRRPDHVVYHFGEHVLLTDVSGTCPIQNALLPRAALQPGYAAKQREQQKIRNYPPPDPTYKFEPIVFETFGHWGQHAVAVMQKCALLASQRSNVFQDREAFQKVFWRKLAVALQKANHAMYDRCLRLTLARQRNRRTTTDLFRELLLNS
jgi:hypothetical protein